MIKLFEKYLNSKKLKIVNQKEQEKIVEFRKTRSELKQVIDDYNDILFLFLHKCSIKELKNFALEHDTHFENCSKEELIEKIFSSLQKSFKK